MTVLNEVYPFSRGSLDSTTFGRSTSKGDTMVIDVVKKAEKALSSDENLRDFATLNGMTIEAAKALLERLMREPVVSEKVEEYVFSKDSPPELKVYYAGEEKGYSRGHKTGFAEGVAVGALAVICAVVIGGVTMCLKFMNDE